MLRRSPDHANPPSAAVQALDLAYRPFDRGRPITASRSVFAMGLLSQALLDRGANGCLLNPKDFGPFTPTGRYVDCTGMDNHEVPDLPIGSAPTVTTSTQGNVLLYVHEGALVYNGQTIFSCIQLEANGCVIYDKAPAFSSDASFPHISIQGYILPLQVRQGLLYLPIRPPTTDELESLPCIHITSPQIWDPSRYDFMLPRSRYAHDPLAINLLHCLPTDNDNSIDRQGIHDYLSYCGQLDPHIAPTILAYDLRRSKRIRDRDQVPATPDPSPPPSGENSHPLQGVTGKGDHRTVQVEDVDSDSDDDSVPDLIPGPNPRRYDDDSSSSSDEDSYYLSDQWDSDDETFGIDGNGKVPYNNKAKEATQLKPIPRLTRLKKHSNSWYRKQRRFFPGTGMSTIKKTFENTTQFGTRGAVTGPRLQRTMASPNPILNIPRRQEDVATDSIYSNTPAIDDGSTAAQFFIGTTSKYRSLRPCGNSDGQFTETLMDEIRTMGAMNRIISDKAKAQVSQTAIDIMRTFAIDDWHSETGKPQQNHAEIGLSTTIPKIQEVLNTSGAPGHCWLLAGKYMCDIENHLAKKSLGWKTPMEWMHGFTPDISPILQFQFYEPVFYKLHDHDKWGGSNEALGRFVGFADNIGHAMTFNILTEDGHVIARSDVRTARSQGMEFDNLRAMRESPKLALELLSRADKARAEKSGRPDPAEDPILDSQRRESSGKPIIIDATGLLNRTFISNPDSNGEQHRTKIIGVETTNRTDAAGTDPVLKFKVKHGESIWNEVLSYNKMLEWIERDSDKDDHFRIDAIINHRKAIMETTKGEWEVLIRWANGETSWNCLNLTYTDDPVSVSMYALKNDLLETNGWKRCKVHTKNLKKFSRMVNQSKLKCNRLKPVYKYGFQVPRNHEEAVKIDEKNGNTKWQDSEKLEIQQLLDYSSFESLGLGAPTPEGYQKIPCHMVYDVKFDGRHKSRFVAGGHRTATPIQSVYSGVVSLQGIRLVTFLAELNGMEPWSTDVGNAYLESYTTEKIVFTAGPEFGKELAGHTMKIVKALYGLKMSGKCWHDRLFDVLSDMGFHPSRAEPDIWLRAQEDHYEYIATYVDDLMIVSRKPQEIIKALEGKPYSFTLKGTGPTRFHLGCDYFRDDQGVLCAGPKTYIARMHDQYVALFGESPKRSWKSPVDGDCHPELDTSPLLDSKGVTDYQSILGETQWAITLGRLDIGAAIATLSSFSAAPREGHLEYLKRVVGYLVGMSDGYIRYRTHEPDFSSLPHIEYDWSKTVYGNVRYEDPKDAPITLGKPVVTSSWVDANLLHCHATGRAMNGAIHFVNGTPVEWFAKKQPTVETATYGSEFVAAKNAVQQILALRLTLRYLGVHVKGPSYLFGDNESVVTSGTIPHSPNKKRHHALSYHFVREAIASGVIRFSYVESKRNPADIVSKHWRYSAVWPMLQAILFWEGDTAELIDFGDQR